MVIPVEISTNYNFYPILAVRFIIWNLYAILTILKHVEVIGGCLYPMEVYVVLWLLSLEMDMTRWVQILDQADSISHSTNSLGKSMNWIIFPSAMGK